MLPRRGLVVGVAALLCGCVQGRDSYLGPRGANATQADTLGLENSDRIARLRRLSALRGTAAPSVTQLTAPVGALRSVGAPVPVVRVTFDESAMFDSGSDVPRPEAEAAFAIIADSMRRDVPDAALTVLGHTDAVGSDATNDALSRRRAAQIMSRLVALGVDPGALSTAAIGRRQPIAPNETANGRARNRRVEFLISASYDANLQVIADRPIDPALFRAARAAPVRPPSPSVQILKVRPGAVSAQTAAVDPDLLLRSTTVLPLATPSATPRAPAASPDLSRDI